MQKTLFAQVDLFCGSGVLIACTCHLINNNKYINLATTNNSNNLTTTTNNKNYLTNSNRSGGVSSPGSSLAGALSPASVKLSQQKVAGLCSCSSVKPAPGQLVVTKAKCCRSGTEDPGEVMVDATTSLGAKSRLVLCPPHLPREYRCYCML